MSRLTITATVFAFVLSCTSVRAQFVNEFVSVNSAGEQAPQNSFNAGISGDGRFVLFFSQAVNFIDQDGDGIPDPDPNGLGADIFVRDLAAGITELINVNSAGEQANDVLGNIAGTVDLSGDGRYVVFGSDATNLIDSDGDGQFDDDANGILSDVFVRDRVTGTTELVSVNSLGEQGNGSSAFATISRDGRYVLFSSNATNLVDIDGDGSIDTDANGTTQDLFLHDRQTRVTELISVNSLGVQANNFTPMAGRISDDGRYVAFISRAPNLIDVDGDGVIDPDTNSFRDDIFVRDRTAGITEIVSINNAGVQHNNFLRGSGFEDLDMSADGRYVVFATAADNLIDRDGDGVIEPDVNGGQFDIFIRDREAGTTDILSLDVFGEQGSGSSFHPRITPDGTGVVFASTNMLVDRNGDGSIDADMNGGNQDVFFLDRSTGTLEIVSVNGNGEQGNDRNSEPVTSDDGLVIAYSTESTNLVDSNGDGIFDDDQFPFNQDVVARVPIQSAPPVPPTIEIDRPADGAVVTAGDVVVEGIASDDLSVETVIVNGVSAGLVSTNNPADPAEVAWSVVVRLDPGQQLIDAVATDSDGNTSVARIEVLAEQQALLCDVDGNRVVDRNDIGLIFAARGQAADGPDDPRDANGDGVITINDGRACVLECSNPGCEP